MHNGPASLLSLSLSLLLVAPLVAAPQYPDSGPEVEGWPGYGRDPFHNATWPTASSVMQRIRWQTPVDLAPQYSGTTLLIHYGSPLITPANTVLVTVKTGASGGFQIEARDGATGTLKWTLPTTYQLPPHNWVPSCGSALMRKMLAVPAAGGTVLFRAYPDDSTGPVHQVAFYGTANYLANQATYDANVVITTPITADQLGNVFFGFLVQGPTPQNLQSGIARLAANGTGTWVSAATAANDPNMQKVVYNCAPVLSRDGTSLYVAVNNQATSGFGIGYLLKLNAQTLALQARVRLKDVVNTTSDAYLPDDGTATPTVGPDGDVYFGVLERPFGSNNLRGWMLHFDAGLTQAKLPGAFGWDDTASVVPRSAVPGYAGSSSYLLLTKYNNYGGTGGNGLNKVAVLDPNTSMTDPVSGATVMNEVLTVLGPTPDPNWPGGVREWCINTAAIDPARHSAIINCEDGKVYRWDFATNTLIEPVTLTSGIGEAYTPTLIGPDGTCYAINNAILFALGI